jgi:cytochrome c-type biogenesis protein CcmH
VTTRSSSTGLRAWLPWIGVAVVVVVALLIGTVGQSEPTPEERAQSLASTIRCPSCASQSVAGSETPSSKAVRTLIVERIEEGDTDEEIRDFVASRYGREVLLDPSGTGVGAIVWGLPVVLVIVAIAGLVVRFRQYGGPTRHASAADEALVAEALASVGAAPSEPAPAPSSQAAPAAPPVAPPEPGPDADEPRS